MNAKPTALDVYLAKTAAIQAKLAQQQAARIGIVLATVMATGFSLKAV